MPCYATGSAEGDARLAASEAYAQVTKLTRLLCTACAVIERYTKEKRIMDKDLAAWWAEHQKIDRERIERRKAERRQAKIRGDAMAKLTEEEKIELFGGQP